MKTASALLTFGAKPVNNRSGGKVVQKRQGKHPAPFGPHRVGPHNRFRPPVAAFHQNIGPQFPDQFKRGILIENHNKIYAFKVGQHICPLVLGVDP